MTERENPLVLRIEIKQSRSLMKADRQAAAKMAAKIAYEAAYQRTMELSPEDLEKL